MDNREHFSSRIGFLLISAGCAIGVGNVYRFPILCGAYGGGIFLLFYLLFLIILGIPVMTAELTVGRASQRSIATSFDALEKKGQKWHLTKYLGIGANYVLMMCYVPVVCYFLSYFLRYLNGSIMQYRSVEELSNLFVTEVYSNSGSNILLAAIIILVCFGVCSLGLVKGVERITKWMMAALFLLLFGLSIYSCTLPGAARGIHFYLVPSVQSISQNGLGNVITAAMGQAFFTLSIGIGSIAVFGSYIGKDRRLLGEGLTIIGLDTLVALMAGFIIFPAYFTSYPAAEGIGADQAGPTFLFTTFSYIFNTINGGSRILGILFFLFMLFAAISTVIAVFENITSIWLELTHLNRIQIALINVPLLILLTLPCIFSSVDGSFFAQNIFFGMNLGSLEDYLVSNICLPLGSMIYVLFCTMPQGWGWKNFFHEVNTGNGLALPKGVKPYMSYILPLVIIALLIISVL